MQSQNWCKEIRIRDRLKLKPKVLLNCSERTIHLKNFQFTKRNRLLVPIPEGNEPVDYFKLIFNDEIINLIVTETNRYAEEIFLREQTSENF